MRRDWMAGGLHPYIGTTMSTIKLPPPSFYHKHEDICGNEVGPPTPFWNQTAVEEAVRQALAAQVPVAWMDDGSLRAGSEATAHRVVTDATRRGMNASVAGNFKFPLALIPEKDHGEST